MGPPCAGQPAPDAATPSGHEHCLVAHSRFTVPVAATVWYSASVHTRCPMQAPLERKWSAWQLAQVAVWCVAQAAPVAAVPKSHVQTLVAHLRLLLTDGASDSY